MFRWLMISAAMASAAIGASGSVVAAPLPFVTGCPNGTYLTYYETCAPLVGPQSGLTWGEPCSETNKLAYIEDPSIKTLWCNGHEWRRMGNPPNGVHTVGTPCEPGILPFELSSTDDDFLITCNWMVSPPTWWDFKPRWVDYNP